MGRDGIPVWMDRRRFLSILSIFIGDDEVTIIFTVPGQPVPKGRARAFIRKGHIGHYTPEKTVNFENLVRFAGYEAMKGQKPFENAIELTVRAWMTIPASWSLKKRTAAEMGHIRPTSRPDLDNICKLINDGLNGIVWKDDSQVVELIASKDYCGSPCVVVSVREIVI